MPIANLVGLIHNLLLAGRALLHDDATIFAAAEAKGQRLVREAASSVININSQRD